MDFSFMNLTSKNKNLNNIMIKILLNIVFK